MNKKLALALIGVGMGISMAATTATANSSRCDIAKRNANYYCNVEMDLELCRYWALQAKACGPLEI